MKRHTPQLGEEMSDTERTSAGDAAWADARAIYEDPGQSLDALAARLGLTRYELVLQAKARGWKLRTRSAAKASTKATLQRFKGLLEERLKALEAGVKALGEDVKSTRDVADMNILVRTLEKVLELERKDRAARMRKRTQKLRFDDAERDELARRIAGLQSAGRGREGAEAGRGAASEAAPGLGPLGEAGSASAGGS
jgi:hypothetical protein